MAANQFQIDTHTATLSPLDVRSAEYQSAPYEVLAKLQAESPLARSHRGVEILSYDLCQEVLGDPRLQTADTAHFRQRSAPPILLDFVSEGLLLNMPRERHDPVRKVLARAFGARQVGEQRGQIQEVLRDVLEQPLKAGTMDVVQDFTRLYPMQVLCRFLGVPTSDLHQFAQSAVELELMGSSPLQPAFPRLEAALTTLRDYVDNLVAQRARDPEDDFISALVSAQGEEDALTHTEVVWGIVNLLFAGQDTTRNQLASVIRAITENELWPHLDEHPESIPAVMEEALRTYPVVQFLLRLPTEDVEVGPYAFRKGDRVILNMLAASRDPVIFHDPNAFLPTRDSKYNLLFGYGMHYCLGRNLARLEMQLALEYLAQHLTQVSIAAPVTTSGWRPMLGGPVDLILKFAPVTPKY
ncbi:cytochrome P450 [Rhodococcus sp. NPDC127530]|uniref:cytochrome P450 n=1 Tax=unclassified Rhodococcus (in: high G+C Gram-positive bacteria) TaxID=192944 RepID=UPI00362FFB2F